MDHAVGTAARALRVGGQHSKKLTRLLHRWSKPGAVGRGQHRRAFTRGVRVPRVAMDVSTCSLRGWHLSRQLDWARTFERPLV
jgi:hypothetical protein